MAIDYGTVRIGIAISDPLGVVAQGLETIKVKKHDPEAAVNRIVEIVEMYDIGTVVVGLPRRTDNRIGPSEMNARALVSTLEERLTIPVIMQDERFTSVIANRILRNSTVKAKDKRSVVDQVAAEVILRDYLEQLRRG
ncbi:MAG TPA: Holliday junction resolvase RuvX [Clostridiaceae bacterium]|nr:Holliday junction resolvase RuvX [Clostridiaceae bacterium]